MRIFITGIAGSLGTHLAKELVDMGFEVAGNDIKRLEETELFDLPIIYIWKSSIDLEPEDLPWVPDVVIDAAIEFADRPLANSSPITTVFGNLATAVRILELARKHFPNALLIYPSSFNSIYGWQYIGWAKAQEVLNKTGILPPLPTSVYGWSKASAELLYFSYAIMHKLRVLITRVGSSYGPGGRLDELPHKLIVYSIKGLKFKLRSPRATRLWTYVKDVVDFYRELFNEHIYDYEPASPVIITNAGNAGYIDSSKPNYVATNEEIAQLIKRIAREFGRDLDYEPIDYYEPGEYTPASMSLDYVDKPIKIDIDVTSMQPTWWKPKYTLYDGLKETYNYFLTIFGRSGERGKQ
ncbi:MAG: NAD(P)-dependent oxidoreductase [Vulcanisaeta sp.]|nr:NAD(P)-dependent oxidoreductase [Vulcanisaeta sp.]